MSKSRLLAVLTASVAAVAFPVGASPASSSASARVSGVVVAKELKRGTIVIAARSGAGTTVRARSRAKLGDRVLIEGLRLRDGTLRASTVRVVGHTRRALVRGVVVRALQSRTLVATGRSVIALNRSRPARTLAGVLDGGDLHAGTLAEFEVEFDHGLVTQTGATVLGTVGSVEIEGTVVTVSPLVISIEGLPVTITVPAGMTLPAGLSPGDDVQLRVSVGAGNVFTLVAFGEVENNDENENQDEQEVEVSGLIVSSSTTQLVVGSHGRQFTFASPAGVTLPTLPVGTLVEVKGRMVNGVLTLVRLKVENNGKDDNNSGRGGGGDDDDNGGSGGGGD